ncbi:MAG: tripartite tricarboxylate transporter substrate binding protein [Betaproteobacteria bacterium]|nr:tripartite tricarboxylate transporter substrate binding protein [Betaproteobacteria bacterium]
MKKLAVVIALCAPLVAWAQGWPSARPITLIVPFTPGGNVDFAGRVIATRLQERLKQNVIVENVAGAGGIVGVQRAVQANPDGYTLLIGVDSPISIAKFVTPSAVRYDPQRDLAPIGMLNAAPMIIVGRPGLPANTFGDLVKLARSQPGKLSYGTSGVGTVLHLAMERVKTLAGIDVLHVPYKGGAPLVSDLIGNQVDLAMLVTVVTLPQVQSGKIKAFAVTTAQRVPQAPEIPTLNEFPELKGFDMVAWTGLFAPAKTPAAIVERLNAEVNEALGSPDVGGKFEGQGAIVKRFTPAEFSDFLRKEQMDYAEIARKAGIKEQ